MTVSSHECGTSCEGFVPVLLDGTVSWLPPDGAKLATCLFGALPVPPFSSVDDCIEAMGRSLS